MEKSEKLKKENRGTNTVANNSKCSKRWHQACTGRSFKKPLSFQYCFSKYILGCVSVFWMYGEGVWKRRVGDSVTIFLVLFLSVLNLPFMANVNEQKGHSEFLLYVVSFFKTF